MVLQQGGSAQEAHHIKQQTTEHAQVVAAQQEATREADLKGKVPESEAPDKLYLKREKSKEKNDGRQSEEEKKKRKDEEKKLTLTGKLLDTVA
jgi:hypothetical protein